MLLCLAFSAFSQRRIQGSVHATVGLPLAYANVLLLNAKDSSLVEGAVVNETGLYTFEGLRPRYYLIAARKIEQCNCFPLQIPLLE